MKRVSQVAVFPVLMVVVSAFLVQVTFANPIPVPSIPLEAEDIEITVIDNMAAVKGKYKFGGVVGIEDGETIKMLFPIPSDSQSIHVFVNGEEVEWTITSIKYSVYPLFLNLTMNVIEWKQTVSHEELKQVTVSYVHNLMDFGNSTKILVYALGSAKLSGGAYTKGCEYIIHLSISPKPLKVERYMRIVGPKIGESHFEWVEIGETIKGRIELELLNMIDDLIIRIREKEEEKWISSLPSHVDLKSEKIENGVVVTAFLTFPHTGYKIENVRQEIKGRELRGYADVLKWTGYSAQVVIKKEIIYTFKDLAPNDYTFTLFINGEAISKKEVQIASQPSLFFILPAIMISLVVCLLYVIKRRKK